MVRRGGAALGHWFGICCGDCGGRHHRPNHGRNRYRTNGQVSVAAIAAAGIIAPIMGAVAVSPIAMGLAIASGALFALQVNSNFFWMFKSLLGLTTKGALKTMTMATTLSSVISLPFVMILALVIPA